MKVGRGSWSKYKDPERKFSKLLISVLSSFIYEDIFPAGVDIVDTCSAQFSATSSLTLLLRISHPPIHISALAAFKNLRLTIRIGGHLRLLREWDGEREFPSQLEAKAAWKGST